MARMRLNEEEIAGLEKDLNAILAYFDQLKTVDVTGIEPMIHCVEGTICLKMMCHMSRSHVRLCCGTRLIGLRNFSDCREF
ncbi:MAG: hypothetical protein IPP40_00215 [bacterium]|nr:hypothetical protein [bacterium]